MNLIYLASPYTDPDKAVMEERYRQACKAATALIADGNNVFSPIAHSHVIAEGLPKEWEFWRDIDYDFIDRCDELYVLILPGWKDSVGVKAEIRYAKLFGTPIKYISNRENSVYQVDDENH